MRHAPPCRQKPTPLSRLAWRANHGALGRIQLPFSGLIRLLRDSESLGHWQRTLSAGFGVQGTGPEDRCWLHTMTVAATGQAMQKGIDWRKALRAALADNPFVKGEGLSPKARRELLRHSQLVLAL